jgi:polyisoprenoid-binding protein YceI
MLYRLAPWANGSAAIISDHLTLNRQRNCDAVVEYRTRCGSLSLHHANSAGRTRQGEIMFLSRLPASVALLTLSGAAFASTAGWYAIDPAQSTVRITSSDGTQPYQVSLSNVAGSLRVSGEHSLPRSLDMVFDLKDLHGADAAVDQRLRGSENLWVDRFPFAVTLASEMRSTGTGTFEADASIALRDTVARHRLRFAGAWTARTANRGANCTASVE